MPKTTTTRSAKTTNQMNGKTNGNPMKARMFATRHDMEPKAREEMSALLNRHLAGIFDLYSQAKQAHWNVKGAEFYQLHELYDELAEGLLGFADQVAERVTALGGEALGTVRMAAAASELEEFPRSIFDSLGTVQVLADRFSALARTAREAVDEAEKAEDMVTSDLFIEVTNFLDKSLWFLEAHLQK